MKFAISGKGGTGKSTVAGILAHSFANDHYRVLAVDADPDANLASALGMPAAEATAIIPISEQRKLIKERTGADPMQFGQLFKMNPTVDDIPDGFSHELNGIKLLVMGAVRKGGGGCACPESVLLKSLLSEIILNHREVVIVDFEAGIEHLGRASAKYINRMLVTVEPGSRSVETAKTIMKLADDIGVPYFGIIGNKVQNTRQEAWIRDQFPEELILGMIPYSEIIREADLAQKPLFQLLDASLKEKFDAIYKTLCSGIESTG